MATGGAFKTLGENDIVSTRTLLHEAIPITGTIMSGRMEHGDRKTILRIILTECFRPFMIILI